MNTAGTSRGPGAGAGAGGRRDSEDLRERKKQRRAQREAEREKERERERLEAERKAKEEQEAQSAQAPDVSMEMAMRFMQRPSQYGGRVSATEGKRRSEWLEQGLARRKSGSATVTRGKVLHAVPVSDEFHGLYSLAYSPNGDTIACGFGNGTIQVRWSEAAALKQTVRSGSGNSSVPIMWVRHNRKKPELFYAASACGTVFACRVSGEFTRFTREEKNEVNALDVDMDGSRLVTGGRDAKIRVYDIAKEKLINTYEASATMAAVEPVFRGVHSERVFAVRFHPLVPFVFLTGGWDNAVKIWDIRQKRNCLNTFFGPHICGDCIDIKNDLVVTGSWTNEDSLQLWDLRSYKLVDTIRPTNRETSHKGEFLYAAKFFDGDPYGDMVMVAGSGLLNVEVISLRNKRVLGAWRSDAPVHAIDSHRNFIAFGGAEPMLRVCDFV